MQGFRSLQAAYSPLAAEAADKNSTPLSILWGIVFFAAEATIASLHKDTGSLSTNIRGEFCTR